MSLYHHAFAFLEFNLWRGDLFSGQLQRSLKRAELIRKKLEQSDPGLSQAANVLVSGSLFFLGEFARSHEAAKVAEPAARDPIIRYSRVLRGDINDALAATLGYRALCEWHLGDMDKADRTMREALTEIEKRKQPYGKTVTLFFSVLLHYLNNRPDYVKTEAAQMHQISQNNGYLPWEAAANMFLGWAEGNENGMQRFEEGLEEWRTKGRLALPLWLLMHAELKMRSKAWASALNVLEKAESIIGESDERWIEAKVYVRMAEMLAGLSKPSNRVLAAWKRALEIAEAQSNVRLIEVATMGLASMSQR